MTTAVAFTELEQVGLAPQAAGTAVAIYSVNTVPLFDQFMRRIIPGRDWHTLSA